MQARTPYLTYQSQARPVTSVGGVPIGSSGLGGIYSTFTMAVGDDFDGPLDVQRVGNPVPKYFSSRVESYAGSRAGSDPNEPYGFDIDPYCTGAQDSNRGVPLGTFDVIHQENSVLTMKGRMANPGETPFIMGRPIVQAQLNTTGYLVACPPCIVEFRTSLSSGNPGGTHPATWILNANGVANAPSLEFDWFEANATNVYGNVNVFGTPTGWSTVQGTSTANAVGTGFHTYSSLMTSTGLKYYFDGTLQQTFAHDCTVTGKPFYLIMSSPLPFGGTVHGDTYDAAAWVAAGQNGPTMKIDWWRIWVPTANSPQLVAPLIPMGTGTQVDYGVSINYTFPAFAALWPAATTSDYCEQRRMEDFEPGTAYDGLPQALNYQQFPTGLTWNSTTRNLSGVPAQNNPGRMYLLSTPYLAGSVGRVWRDWIDVGPRIDLTDFVLVNGTATTVDLYFACNCGTLSTGKVITCTGLPAGLSFDGQYVTGTPTVNATTAITVKVTNAVGQTASKTVNLIVQAAADALAIDGSVYNGTLQISTTKPRDILVAAFYNSGGHTGVSVTSTSGLQWVRRGWYNAPPIAATAIPGIEVWYARANSVLTNETVSILLNNGGTTVQFGVVFAVNGANMVTPFDPNASLASGGALLATAEASGTQTTMTSTAFSTTSANTLTYAVMMNYLGNLGTITDPSGFATAGTPTAGNAGNASYKVNSSPLSGATATYSWVTATANKGTTMIVDALQGQA